MKRTFATLFYGTVYSVTSDWSDPDAQISFGESGREWFPGWKVSRFKGSPRSAMRARLRSVASFHGEDPDSPSVSRAIKNAVSGFPERVPGIEE